ncbi:hypothetical protein GQ457_10G012480 [Hibiscus cannabinus]
MTSFSLTLANSASISLRTYLALFMAQVGESCLHILHDCPATKALWMSILQHQQIIHFFFSIIDDWILSNIQSNFLFIGTDIP